MTSDREAARSARAKARLARGMSFAEVEPFSPTPPLHEGESPEARWAAMERLCRAAWLATGRPLPSLARSELPGEVFWIDDAGARRPL